MKEFELYLALKESLRSLGMDIYGEVSLGYGSAIDMVGVSTDKYIGIEIKRSNSRKLISQAVRTKKYCHITFVATPKEPNEKFIKRLSSHGIGFMKITPNDGKTDIDILLRPKEHNPRRKFILHPYYKNQVGGVSIQSGPQRRTIFQQLTIDIEAYLKARVGIAIKKRKVYDWVRKYCIGPVSARRLNSVMKISENIIIHKTYATYFESYETRLSAKGRSLIIEKAINNARSVI